MYLRRYRLSDGDTAAFDYDINILAWASKKTVADISADDKGSDALLSGCFRNYPENLMIEKTVCYC